MCWAVDCGEGGGIGNEGGGHEGGGHEGVGHKGGIFYKGGLEYVGHEGGSVLNYF